MNRSATIVAYNDEICYGVQSLKLNDYHKNHVYYRSLIERLAKTRNQWFENDSPFQKTLLSWVFMKPSKFFEGNSSIGER